MAGRAAAQEEKRQVLLAAAVRVFARHGYHATRVGEIAKEAGVAYGLLYHYFSSKEEVLETIFRQTWADLLARIAEIEESGEPAPEQLRRVAAVVLRSWRRDPDLVTVLVREVTRSPQLQEEIGEIALAFDALERVIRGGQERGELRRDIDARLGALVLYGALEEILTSWVLGQLPGEDEDVARAEAVVVGVLGRGLFAT